MPLVGRNRFLDFCDYHFIGKVCDLKRTLILDYEEAKFLWQDKRLSQDYKMFVEKIEFLKPLFHLFDNEKCFTTTEKYWNLINDNFCFGGYAIDNIATISFSWRDSAIGKGRSAIKCSKPIKEDVKHECCNIVEKYGKIKKSKIVFVSQSDALRGFK